MIIQMCTCVARIIFNNLCPCNNLCIYSVSRKHTYEADIIYTSIRLLQVHLWHIMVCLQVISQLWHVGSSCIKLWYLQLPMPQYASSCSRTKTSVHASANIYKLACNCCLYLEVSLLINGSKVYCKYEYCLKHIVAITIMMQSNIIQYWIQQCRDGDEIWSNLQKTQRPHP